jgi:hypothetical protein
MHLPGWHCIRSCSIGQSVALLMLLVLLLLLAQHGLQNC